MSLKPTIDKTLENIKRTFIKLKWMNGSKTLSKDTLRRCFFDYDFSYFVWIFPLYSFLTKTQKELLQRKFRNSLRLIHRCPFARATDLLQITKAPQLEEYVKRYIKKRFQGIHNSDISWSPFYNDIFYWSTFHKSKHDSLGNFFSVETSQRKMSMFTASMASAYIYLSRYCIVSQGRLSFSLNSLSLFL